LNTLLNSSLLFFAFVMLVEPLTAPVGKRMRIFYGAVVAAIVVSLGQWTSVPYAFELSLLISNLIAWLIRWKTIGAGKIILKLTKTENAAPNTVSFWFEPLKKMNFTAGQFLEWTVAHRKPDLRGFRRWFTIAASPSENMLMLTTKFSEKSSSFKQALKDIKPGDEITATGPDGEFVLPKATQEKLVFIAGGIGITPFRSMVKYLLDTNQSQPIVLMYSNRTAADIAFRPVWEEAQKKFGLKAVYTITDEVPKDWQGRVGFIDPKMIKEEVPDWQERTFYVSGPEPMVQAFVKMLAGMGIADKKIRRDYFPGYTETYS
ncbi:MAG TPA: RnfABCDGE type electron transport complex subunit D, partial [Patescibacteria group bacterium]|nr:RnfABCDGE type electron transport complex subunit D [Patescibacteria group bacterium]